jgi:hypothetical protein
MDTILAYIIFTAVAAFAGSIAGYKYFSMVSHRQQKAILVLLIQEFSLMIKRCVMYYSQFLKGAVSFSALFEISDSSTFNKLVELTENMDCIKHATEFKAGVFQAVRYVNRASELIARSTHFQIHGKNSLAKKASHEAKIYQNMALNFFIGERQSNGKFYRNLYVKHIKNLEYLLNYLKRLNSEQKITDSTKKYKRQKESIDAFISEQQKMLSLITEIIELLREKEQLQIQKIQKASQQIATP